MTSTLEAHPGLAAMLSSDLHDALVRRTASEHKMPSDLAERSVDQALVMLQALKDNPGVHLHPPKVIDFGWHMFILHTSAYTQFCDQLAGHYIHHNPADGATDGGTAVRESARYLREHGYPIDEELWAMTEATNCENACSGCDNSVG